MKTFLMENSKIKFFLQVRGKSQEGMTEGMIEQQKKMLNSHILLRLTWKLLMISRVFTWTSLVFCLIDSSFSLMSCSREYFSLSDKTRTCICDKLNNTTHMQKSTKYYSGNTMQTKMPACSHTCSHVFFKGEKVHMYQLFFEKYHLCPSSIFWSHLTDL